MQRTMSMASHAVQSEASRGGYTTAGAQSDRMHERELGLSGRRPMGDAASDTSSTRERKFANLLGGGSESGSDRDISPAQVRSVGHRLYYNGCGREKVKQEQLREERERLLLAEMAQMTQRPNITARARSKMSKGAYFADHATLWSQQRDNRLRKVAQEVAQERFAEVRDKPTLNQRSEALLKSAGDYKGPVRHWKEHFDKFSARRMRDATGAAAAKAANPASPGGQLDFTPNINANAVRVDVERDISDRLYQESSARQERLRQRAFEQQARDMTDPATGRPLFTPHSLRRAGSPPRRDPYEVSQQLHEESFEAQRRREQRVEAHPDAQHAFKPTINASSEELAKRARKPLYLSRAQRAEEERQRREKIQRARSAEPSPRVGDNVVGGRISVDEFLRRAQRNEMTRAQKLDMIRREQEDRELSECSFQPAISRRSEDIFYASNVSGTPMRSPLEAHMGSPLPTDRGTNYSGPTSVARHQQQHQQRQQQQQQQPGTPLVATARQSASPVRASPTPSGHKSPRFGGSGRYGAGGGNAADDFAALMAASGLGGAGGSPVPSHGGAAARGSVPAGSSPNAAAAAARRQPPPPSAADMTANTDLAAAPSPVVRRAASLGGASQGPHHHPNASGMGDVDQYIAAFESQMYSVLEEWRKLEEV